MYFGIDGVVWIGARVVEEIAIEIDVVLVGASQVGEAVGIERVDEKQRDASGELCCIPSFSRAAWMPAAQSASMPCVPLLTISRDSASSGPKRATSVARSSPLGPRSGCVKLAVFAPRAELSCKNASRLAA